MCLNSLFEGISLYETATERTLSDTLQTQHLQFLLRCFCCKSFTLFLTRLKFKSNIYRWILQAGVSKTRLWSETHGPLLYDDETEHWFGSNWCQCQKLYIWYPINHDISYDAHSAKVSTPMHCVREYYHTTLTIHACAVYSMHTVHRMHGITQMIYYISHNATCFCFQCNKWSHIYYAKNAK